MKFNLLYSFSNREREDTHNGGKGEATGGRRRDDGGGQADDKLTCFVSDLLLLGGCVAAAQETSDRESRGFSSRSL